MSVFLRWGIFGILATAGLLYAYNASKRMAENRAARSAPDTSVTADVPPGAAVADVAVASTPPAAAPATEPQCEEELVVAERAIHAQAQGEPLDRLLRIQEIAFQDPPRRARLEKVAIYWFELKGAEPDDEELRKTVIGNCLKARNP